MPDLEARRVLVPGAAGFIGANLVRELLVRGAEVHALVRPSSPARRLDEVAARLAIHRVDLADGAGLAELVARVRPHAVVNLAMAGGHPGCAREREEALRVSVLGTAALLDALEPFPGCRLVHAGSSLEYGPRPRPLAEADALEPVSFRGAAKASATLLVRQFARARSRPAVILRPFSVYGPWEPEGRLVPAAIRAALLGEELPLTPPGCRHDFVFVGDVVEALGLALAADVEPGEAFNVGSGREWTNEELVAAVAAATGRCLRVRAGAHPPRSFDSASWVADVRRARERLGWSARHDLGSGLGRTVAWMAPRLGAAAQARA